MSVIIPRCILSKFYIKPQRKRQTRRIRRVVSYRNSTSNHNVLVNDFAPVLLYLIEILHQTTTARRNTRKSMPVVSYRNSTSNHNAATRSPSRCGVVSYRNSTSNHNSCLCISEETALYLIEILHQTTTSGLILIDKVLLTGCLPL